MDAAIRNIAPYSANQVRETLTWLERSKEFINGVKYFYPEWTENEIILKFGLIECDGRIYISNKPEFNNKDNSQFRYL